MWTSSKKSTLCPEQWGWHPNKCPCSFPGSISRKSVHLLSTFKSKALMESVIYDGRCSGLCPSLSLQQYLQPVEKIATISWVKACILPFCLSVCSFGINRTIWWRSHDQSSRDAQYHYKTVGGYLPGLGHAASWKIDRSALICDQFQICRNTSHSWNFFTPKINASPLSKTGAVYFSGIRTLEAKTIGIFFIIHRNVTDPTL